MMKQTSLKQSTLLMSLVVVSIGIVSAAVDFNFIVSHEDTSLPFNDGAYVADGSVTVDVDDGVCEPGEYTVAIQPLFFSAPDETTPPAPATSTYIDVPGTFHFVNLGVGTYIVYVQNNTSADCADQLASTQVVLGQLPTEPEPEPEGEPPVMQGGAASSIARQSFGERHEAPSDQGDNEDESDMQDVDEDEEEQSSQQESITETTCKDAAFLLAYREQFVTKNDETTDETTGVKQLPILLRISLTRLFRKLPTAELKQDVAMNILCELAIYREKMSENDTEQSQDDEDRLSEQELIDVLSIYLLDMLVQY